jgi:GntR family transcriptional regulator
VDATAPTNPRRQNQAQALIRGMVDSMVRLQFSFSEIRDLVHAMLLEREERLQNFCIAVVDCNPEALGIYEKQLLYLSRAQVRKILLDDVRHSDDVAAMFRAFDLVLTTTTHHAELTGLLPAQKEKVLPAIVAPTPQTAAALDAIPPAPSARVGLLCLSANFRDIIRRHLAARTVAEDRIEAAFYQAGMDLNAFLRDKTHLILPPDFPLFSQGGYGSTLVRFSESGGRVIQFDYQIERGSLLTIEAAISKLLTSQVGA